MKPLYLSLLLLSAMVGCKNKGDIMKSPNEFQAEGLLRLEEHLERLHTTSLISGYRACAKLNFDSAMYYQGELSGIHKMDSVILLELLKLKNNRQ